MVVVVVARLGSGWHKDTCSVRGVLRDITLGVHQGQGVDMDICILPNAWYGCKTNSDAFDGCSKSKEDNIHPTRYSYIYHLSKTGPTSMCTLSLPLGYVGMNPER